MLMSDEKNESLSWLAFAFPPLLTWFIFEVDWLILSEVDKEYPTVQWISVVLSLIPGWFLFKRSRVVKDHEWHRVKQLSNLKKVYSAEDKGVWNNDDRILLQGSGGAVELGELGKAALESMQGNIGGLTKDNLVPEVERNPNAKVEMLMDAEYVTRTTSRIEGKEMMSENLATAATRAEPKEASIMDRIIDKLGSLISGVSTKKEATILEPSEESLPEDGFDDLLAYGEDSKPVEQNFIVDVKYCKICEAENKLEERYCVVCGADI